MPRPYTQEFRDRVIGAIAAGSSARAAGRKFGVSTSTAAKWARQWHRAGGVTAKPKIGVAAKPRGDGPAKPKGAVETKSIVMAAKPKGGVAAKPKGGVAAKPKGGDIGSPPDPRAALLLDLIEEHPDLTVEEIRAWLRTRGVQDGRGLVGRILARYGIISKKPSARRSGVKGYSVLRVDFESRSSARRAAYCGFVAAFVVLGFSVYQVLKAITASGVDPTRNWTVIAAILTTLGLQCAAVVGLYNFSRIAAVGSFVIFLALAVAVFLLDGVQSPIVSIAVIVLLLAFIQGIRGTIAYHRRPKQKRQAI